MNKEGKYFRYTNQERIYETKRIKYQKTLEKYKEKNEIKEIEEEKTKDGRTK